MKVPSLAHDSSDDDLAVENEPTQITRAPRKRNREQSRARILDAAESAFANRGFDGARLRDIAQAASVHHALVHPLELGADCTGNLECESVGCGRSRRKLDEK
jgi:hypothetical protein